MRVTRYVWITNLPSAFTEEELRGALNSYGKVQGVKVVDDGAVVTFVETKSATKVIDSIVKLHKNILKMQYCESSEAPFTDTPQQRSDQRSDSLSDSKSVAGEIDTDSTSSSPYSSHSSSPPIAYPKRSYSPVKRDHRKGNNGSQDRSLKYDSRGNRRQDGLRGLKITQLPLRSSDTNLREGLFHEYKKHGKITSLAIKGTGSSRFAHITFKLSEDAEKAYEHSKGKVFFGVSVHAELVDGLDIEDPDLCPPEHAMDEYHPKATKTLFVGNLCSATITEVELQRVFQAYGDIIEIDIKTQTNQPGTSYAFVQYTDIKSVVRALSDQESITISGKSVKLGFGKSQPSNVVWLDNLSPNVTETFLMRQFGRYGRLKDTVVDSKLGRALLYFDTVEAAQRALNETRNRSLLGRKVQIDYATLECQVAFMEKFGTVNNFYGKYRDKLREIVEAYMPCGNLMSYLEENRGSQGGFNRRTKDLATLIGSADLSRSSKYGYNRSSHHSSSRNGSPVRGSLYSRGSPSREYTNLSGASFRNSGGGLLSSLIGISNYKHHSCSGDSPRASSNRDRSRYSQCRKSVAPSSLECSRMSNGGGSYQHPMGYSNGDVSPHRQQSWSNGRKYHYAASTCSDSSVERKQDKKESRSHKQGSDRQRMGSSKRKASHRTSLEHHRHRDDPSSPQMSSSRRHPRNSAISTPELSQPTKSGEGGGDPHNGTRHVSKGKTVEVSRSFGQQQKVSVMSTCSSNGETLTKLQRERMELLMKLSMVQTKHKSEVITSGSSAQAIYNGVNMNSIGSAVLPESQPIRIPTKVGSDFAVSASSGSGGQSSSSDPGDVMFSPNIGPRASSDRSSPSQVSQPPPPPPPLPPPPPPPPPLPLRLSSGVVPSPGLPTSSPLPSSFYSIASPPPWDTQSTTIESDLPLLAARMRSPLFCSDPQMLPVSAPPFTSKPDEIHLSPPRLASTNSQKLSHDSDSEQAVDTLDSSLDERIRRLDAKLQHSEKIRPTVDYSKFRIRRKSDLITSTTANASSSQASVPISTSVVSTDITMSPLRLFTSPTSPDMVNSTTSPSVRPTDTSEFVKSMLSSSRSSTKINNVDSIVSSISTHHFHSYSPPPPPTLSIPHHPLPAPHDKSTILSPITRSPLHTGSPTCSGNCKKLENPTDLKPPPPPPPPLSILHTNLRSSTPLHNATAEVSSTPSPSTTASSGLSRSPGKSTGRVLQNPGIKPILKKDNTIISTVPLTPKAMLRSKEAQNSTQMKNLFPPQPAQTMQILKKKSQQVVSPGEIEKESILSTISSALTRPLPNGSAGHKRRLPTPSVPHLSPKSPKISMPSKAKSREDGKTNCLLSKSVSDTKEGERDISPKPKKACDVSLIPAKSSKRQLVSSPTTPFERNKLHFKKLARNQAAPGGKKSQGTISTSNASKFLKSPSAAPECRGVTSKCDSSAKKRRLKRKRQESDEDDWKPQGGLESIKVEDIVTDGVLYETMYDKIKRRGNKDYMNDRPEAKPEALKSLLKSRKHKVGGGAKAIEQTPYESEKNSDANDAQNEPSSRRPSKKPPHLTPESAEPMRPLKTLKKSRLKRPESEGGSSSDSDNRLSVEIPSNRRKRVLSVACKRRVSGDIKSGGTSTESKNPVVKRRVARKLVTLFSNSSDSDSDCSPSARNLPRAFFPERRRSTSRSSSTSSTPQISRSCSPVAVQECGGNSQNNKNDDETGDSEEAAIDALPLLEKQISNVENEEEEDVVVASVGASSSPPPALPVTEEMKLGNPAVVKQEKEDVLIKAEKAASAEVCSVAKPSRSCGGGLILTSPLVKPDAVSKAEELGDFEESGLALLSSAAEAEAIKQEAEELQKPALLSPKPSAQAQPLTLLAPLSVIPASASVSQQHITLVVNTISNASSAPQDPASTSSTSKGQSTFVLAPSTFSLVTPVAIPTDNKQLIVSQTPLPQSLPDQPAQNKASVAKPCSSNMTEFVQHIIEQVTQQKKEESSQSQEKVKRAKKSAQQNCPHASTAVATPPAIHFPPEPLHKPSQTAANLVLSPTQPVSMPVDPYEPNFDEPEAGELVQPPSKDTVAEVINSVVHGEFEQKDYVQRLVNGTRVSPSGHNSMIATTSAAASVRPALNSTPQISPLPPQELLAASQQSVGIPSNSLLPSKSSPSEVPNVLDVTPASSFAEDPRFLAKTVQAPSTIVVTSPEPPLIQHQQQPPQQLVEPSPIGERSSIPANILSPLQVFTLMAPTSTKSSEAVPQQISPQTQPQLQEIAACLAKNYFTLLSQGPPPQAFVDAVDSANKDSPNSVHPAAPPPSTTSQNVEFYAAATMAAMAAMSPSPSEAAAAAAAAAAAVVASSPKQHPAHFSPQPLPANFWWLDPQFLEDKLQLVWRGCMSLKNERASVRMLYLAGNQDLIRTCLQLMTVVSDETGGATWVLRVAQRMRLENSQLEAVQWKLREPANYCMCLALAAGSPPPPSPTNTAAATAVNTGAMSRRTYVEDNYFAQQNMVLQNVISYLQDKTAAGIISCPSSQENPFVMHIFPPCDFTTAQLRYLSPELQQTLTQSAIPFMLIVVV
ncbi:Msx2-interacting protein [Taenia crassiceps]|uniref:Msx2-interacting protein n=1 Tax=Taenia crassiceps TaxID=6207 RepID=A0ABR4QGA4_9CEST